MKSDKQKMAEEMDSAAEPVLMPEAQSTSLAESKGVSNPMVLIQAAIERGMDPDKLGKLMDLQERWEKNRAAEAFALAIRNFQAEMPPIIKGQPVRNSTGKLMYSFADFDDLMEVAQPILNKHGITVTFSTRVDGSPPAMTTTCHVRVGIHVQDTSVTLGLPAIPNANDAQRAGGALSYGQRYSMKAALNIRIKGEDNDAGSPPALIDKEDLLLLQDAIKDSKTDHKRFLEWAQLESLEHMSKEFLPKAMDMLKKKKEKAAK